MKMNCYFSSVGVFLPFMDHSDTFQECLWSAGSTLTRVSCAVGLALVLVIHSGD